MSDTKKIVNSILEGASVRKVIAETVTINRDSIYKKLGLKSQDVFSNFIRSHFKCESVRYVGLDYALNNRDSSDDYYLDAAVDFDGGIDGVPIEFRVAVRIFDDSYSGDTIPINCDVLYVDPDSGYLEAYFYHDSFNITKEDFNDPSFVNNIYGKKLEQFLSESPIVSILKSAVAYYRENNTLDGFSKLEYY